MKDCARDQPGGAGHAQSAQQCSGESAPVAVQDNSRVITLVFDNAASQSSERQDGGTHFAAATRRTCRHLAGALLRWVLCCSCLAAVGPAAANTHAGHQPLNAAERQVLLDSRERVLPLFFRQAWAECMAEVEATRALALRHWGQETWQWWASLWNCGLDRPDLAQPPTRAEVEAAMQPALTFLAAAPPGVEVDAALAVRLWVAYWSNLQSAGDVADGVAVEQAWVRTRLDAAFGPGGSRGTDGRNGRNSAIRTNDATATTADAQPQEALGMAQRAAAELQIWADGYYGAHGQVASMRRWHVELTARLGPTQALTLALHRALAFAARQLGRPQEAIALSEAAMALLEQQRPQSERLLMRQLSEHANCLAAVGRLVEAREAMQRLATWLQRQHPVPQAPLMRLHYNLAAIGIALGDFDAAAVDAQASMAHALQAPTAGDRFEHGVGLLRLAEARLLGGEPQAAQELQAALALRTPLAPETGSPVVALARHAARVGDAQRLAWSADFLARYTERQLDPIHPDRALLPLVRAWQAGAPFAGAAAAGALPGPLEVAAVQRSVARALVLSLSGRAGAVEAQTHFALARLQAAERPAEALWLYKRGANALQRLRARLGNSDDSLQRSWLSEHEADLRAFIGLLIDQGRLFEAQQAIALLRSEELHEYTRRSARGVRSTVPAALGYSAAEATRNARMAPVAAAVQAMTAAADQRADTRLNWAARMSTPDPTRSWTPRSTREPPS